MIALVITINKFKNHFENKNVYFVCDNLDAAKSLLINKLVEEFGSLNIDFPDDLNEFETIIFNREYVKGDVFSYNIFSENNWIKPWADTIIYEELLEKLYEEEIKNPPDFSKLYKEEYNSDEDQLNCELSKVDIDEHLEDCDCATCQAKTVPDQ